MKNENLVDTSDLDSNRTDKNVFLLKTAIKSIIPGIGGEIFSEIIGSVIPNQQMNRVILCVKEIATVAERNAEDIDVMKKWLEKLQSSPVNLLLFEQTMRGASQTESEIKHHCYAYYIFNTVQNKKYKDAQHEKILRTLSELTEEEIVYLVQFSSRNFSSAWRTECKDKNSKAFRDEYVLTLEQKGLISVIIKHSGTKFPLNENGDDVAITDYGEIVVEAIYDEDFLYRS